jgi:hypothetical protein
MLEVEVLACLMAERHGAGFLFGYSVSICGGWATPLVEAFRALKALGERSPAELRPPFVEM